MMAKTSRRWWIGVGVLLVSAFVLVLRPRPICIPLKDGTVLTIAAVTVGTEHRRPEPISWGAIQAQVARRTWGWPTRTVTMPESCVMLWFEDAAAVKQRSLRLVDRHGWEWYMSSGSSDGTIYQACFRPVETDGSVRVEVHGKDGLLGAALVPLETARPVATPDPIPTVPPTPVKFGEPAPLPILQTTGPLQATLRSFEVRGYKGSSNLSEGRFRLETLWNGQPITPEIAWLTLTDRFGRREMLFPQAEQPIMIQLHPQGAIWDLHFQIYRSLDTSLHPDETVRVTPRLAVGTSLFQQDGTCQGRAWRLSLIPSGAVSLPARFSAEQISLQEDVPVIVVEVDPARPMRVRIETLDQENEYFPATGLAGRPFPPNVFAARSPDFDTAKGHTISIGFDEPQLVQFTIRPNVKMTE